MITKFGVSCVNCLERSKPHIVWHEQKAFTFICYNCESTETIKMDYETLPSDVEEYDTRIKESNQKTIENADKIIEKKLN